MIVAGMLCGAGAYFATTPFHLMKTRAQAAMTNSYQFTPGSGLSTSFPIEMIKMIREHGVVSLWQGSIPLATRGGLFTAGQMLGYDGLKTLAREYGIEDSPQLHVIASISAAFWSSFAAAPADLIMTRCMSSETDAIHTIQAIYSEGGIHAFWRGWGLFFVRLVPVMLTYSTVYEQSRKSFGLGYMS